jgi:hypothetical protein
MAKKLLKKINDKEKLLSLFDNAIEKATHTTMQNSEPIITANKDTFVGLFLVHKKIDNCYEIRESASKKPLYKDIYLYEAAISIAQRLSKGITNSISEILKIDKDYSKHRNDMVHYLHCYKVAIQKKDIEKMSILEDKFQMSEQLSKLIKNRMSKFKLVR